MTTARPKDSTRWRCYLFFPVFLGLAAIALATDQEKIVRILISPEEITWQPQVEAERWVFTVSGEGIYLREIYEPGDTPSLSAIGPDGVILPDDSYNWELRAIGTGEPDERRTERRSAEEEEEAEAEDVRRVRTERGFFERRTVRPPVVESGSFRIQGGAFVVEDRREREESE